MDTVALNYIGILSQSNQVKYLQLQISQKKNSYYVLYCMLDLNMKYELQFACRQGIYSN